MIGKTGPADREILVQAVMGLKHGRDLTRYAEIRRSQRKKGLVNTRSAKLTLACLMLCSLQLAAHPSTALVVDDRNNVYFGYWGGTWKLDSSGQLSRFHASDFHFMALDPVGRFAGARIADAVRITPDGSRPVLFSFPESSATFHSDGDLYIAAWSIGRIRVERVRPDGGKTVFADAAIDPRIARKPGRHEGGLIAIASGPKGLYVSDGASIWTIDARGDIAPFALTIAVPDCPADLPAELPKPHVRSISVDTNGDVYAAAIGCRATLRITASGQVSTVLRAESPWSPSGVAISAGNLYVMEYDNPLTEYPADGRPRIRKQTRDGKVTTLTVMEKGTQSNPHRP